MGNSIPLGRIRGISVGMSWTVLLVVALVSFNVSSGLLPAVHPEAGALVIGFAGLLGAIGLLASILAHEVAHGIVAQRNGIKVKSITLWALGGVAQLEGEPQTPGADFRIAAVGPLTSFVLGIGFGILGVGGAFLTGGSIATTLLQYLGIANIALAIFNLLPATPLDGGRVLRAAVWKLGNNRSRAVAVASGAGQVLGIALMVLGGYQLLERSEYGGLWYMLIGFFLYTTAKQEGLYTKTVDRLAGRQVSELLRPGMAIVPTPEMTVEQVLHQVAPITHLTVYPVLGAGGMPIGVVRRARLEAIPGADRQMPVGMLVEGAGAVQSTAPLLEAARTLGPRGAALVYEGSELRGVLTAEDLEQALAR